MPISTISQVISTIPEAGRRGVDVQTVFVNKQEDFQDHLQGTTVTELNALKTQINTTVSGMNDAVTNVNTKASEAGADALSASASATTATTKAGEASTSASQALASKNKAAQWADADYNVEVEVGKYSAKHWATVAQSVDVSNKVNTDMSGYTDKATPVDADLIPLSDSDSSFGIKKLSWANLKATILNALNELTAKTTPVDEDIILIGDSASSYNGKKLTFANLKAFISPSSTETAQGLIELSTTAEAQAGIDDSRAITPLKLRNALNATGTAPIYACRAWVNFNGTGTVAIRASGNVSSITDNGVGDYTVNFTTAMPDANYVMAGTCRDAPPNDNGGVIIAGRDDWIPTTQSRRFNTTYGAALYDVSEASVVVFI